MALYIETEDGLKPQSFKGHAAGTYYDNTESGLEADNAQDAIDETNAIKANKTNLSNYILTGTKPSETLSTGTFFVDKDGALRVATADIATTDDVGSGNSAVKSVGEILAELNSNLTANTFDTGISVNADTDYTLLSDGYFTMYYDGSNSNNHGTLRVNGETMITSNVHPNEYVTNTLYLKKGMIVRITGTGIHGTFTPLHIN